MKTILLDVHYALEMSRGIEINNIDNTIWYWIIFVETIIILYLVYRLIWKKLTKESTSQKAIDHSEGEKMIIHDEYSKSNRINIAPKKCRPLKRSKSYSSL